MYKRLAKHLNTTMAAFLITNAQKLHSIMLNACQLSWHYSQCLWPSIMPQIMQAQLVQANVDMIDNIYFLTVQILYH